MTKHITDELLAIHIQLGVIKYLEREYKPYQVIAIVQENGQSWRDRSNDLIREMEEREAYFEAERVNHMVDPHDPAIMAKVDQIIMCHLDELRAKIYTEIKKDSE